MISLTEEFDHCWAVFHPHFPQLQKPQLHIRFLRKAWGICRGKSAITLNRELESANINFVWHVIFHEMCHLIHPNHKLEFYLLLNQFDPLRAAVESMKQKRLEELKSLKDEI